MNVSDFHMSDRLTAHCSTIATDAPDETMLTNAQQRLHRRLDQVRPPIRVRRLAWAGAACAVLLVAVALLTLPLVSSDRGVAFAAVQQHLRNFKTLTMTITQEANGIHLPTIHVWTDKAGNTRSDIGTETSVIVNTQEHTLLVLLHAPHKAMRMPLDPAKRDQTNDPLAWLDTVRNFQGSAAHLPKQRVIDGVTTDGWALHASGMDITLWADRDGFPRAVDIGGNMEMHQRLTLEIDTPIDPARFSTDLPAGYSLMRPD